MKTARTAPASRRRAREPVFAAAAGVLIALLTLVPPLARAVDTEVFFADVTYKPKVLFIVDTSASMWTLVNGGGRTRYDTDTDNLGKWASKLLSEFPSATACPANRIYYNDGSTSQVPVCTVRYFDNTSNADNFQCRPVEDILASKGTYTSSQQDYKFTQFVSDISTTDKKGVTTWKTTWNKALTPVPVNTLVRCNHANAMNGAGVSSNPPPPSPRNAPASGDFGPSAYTFYTSDYLNYDTYWRLKEAQSGPQKRRVDVVLKVIRELVEKTPGIEWGFMRYGEGNAVDGMNTCTIPAAGAEGEGSGQGNGAFVLAPIKDNDYIYKDADYTAFQASVQCPIGGDYGCNAVTRTGSVLSYKTQKHVDKLSDLFADLNPVSGAYVTNAYAKFTAGGTCSGATVPLPNIPMATPNGKTPMADAMLEAYTYFRGIGPWMGTKSGIGISSQHNVGSDLTSLKTGSCPIIGGNSQASLCYRSPITSPCDRGFIILLSDGTTEQDNVTSATVKGLNNFTTTGTNPTDDDFATIVQNPDNSGKLTPGQCDADNLGSASNPSDCVNDIAKWMARIDMTPGDDQLNNIRTFTVGFQLPSNQGSYRTLLQKTARDGDGEFFEATSESQLRDALDATARIIQTQTASFVSPAVSIDAFNRTQNLDEVYFAMFRPGATYRWRGNVKRYKLGTDGELYDRQNPPQLATLNGQFRTTAQSFWPEPNCAAQGTCTDGNDVRLGGAARQLKSTTWNARNIKYQTTSGGTTLASLCATPTSLTATQLGIQTGDKLKSSSSTALTPDLLVQWFCGKDIDDVDLDGDTAEIRGDMGDPLHSKPVLATYMDSSGNVSRVLYVATNDGLLHAFDPGIGSSSDTASELWAFLPKSMLARLRDLYVDPTTDYTNRVYGLDGSLRIERLEEVTRNSVIDTGETAYLYFGQRRGGKSLFSINVSSTNSFSLAWEKSPTNIGFTWSTPVPTAVYDPTDGGKRRRVLVVGGGADTQVDSATLADDTLGKGIYVLDAATGDTLWDSGSGGTSYPFSEMRYGFAADVSVVDLDGDRAANRVYAADVGGQLWRLDFDYFGASSADGKTLPTSFIQLIQVNLLASLGAAATANSSDIGSRAQTRRFFYPPDPSFLRSGSKRWLNLAIGSGHRELPKTDILTQDRFFSIRDTENIFGVVATGDYPIITTDDLAEVDLSTNDATVVASDQKGWMIDLPNTGEKVLAEARTFNNLVYYTSYTPTEQTTDPGAECTALFGLNRLYVMDVRDAKAVNNLDGSTDKSVERSTTLKQPGIAPEVVFVFPKSEEGDTGCSGFACRPSPVCLVGLEKCGSDLKLRPVRTFWKQRGAE